MATPFEEIGGKGSFDVQLSVAGSDEFTDCLDPAQAPNGCVVGTRADHTRTADRSADVLLPVTFTTGGTGGGGAGGGTSSPSPSSTPSSSSAAGAAGGTGSDLAETGSSITPAALAGLALLGGGAAAVIVRRRSSEETNRP